jgi:hypothetical protein
MPKKVVMKYIWLFFMVLSISLQGQSNYEIGKALFEQGKFKLAQGVFEAELEMNSGTRALQIKEYLGDIAAHQSQWDVSLGFYGKLKIIAPLNANYHYKYGGALAMKAKQGNKLRALWLIDDIRKSFETAAKLDPRHIDVRWALMQYYLELPVIVGGSEAKALKYANELMALSAVDGYLAKGFIALHNGSFQQAELMYVKAHEIGHSKTTFKKLYDLYLTKFKNESKAAVLKAEFEK